MLLVWSQIWLITKREITANARNFKILVALMAMTLLSLLSARAMTVDYENRLSNWRVNQDRQRDPAVGGDISYNLADGSFVHGEVFGHTPPIQSPRPFSALIKGMSGEMDRAVNVGQQIVFWARQDEPATSAIFNIPDTSFVIKLLVSLFALMFSFDTVTQEKESGTLRAMMSQPVSRSLVIISKSLGASVSLLAPFTASYFMEIIYLHLAHGLPTGREDLIRALLIFGMASLYGIVFTQIGIFISTITRQTKIAVTTALLTWATIVLILPNAAVLIAKLLTPAPSYNHLNASLYEERKRFLQDEAEADRAARQSTGRIGDQMNLLRLFEIQRQATDDYLTIKKDQNRLARLFAALSPAGALTFGACDLAGTGVDAYNSYLDSFRSDRDVMLDALRRRLDFPGPEADRLLQKAHETTAGSRQRAPSLGASAFSFVISITSLVAWGVFFVFAACWGFRRYDVR
ncbi:MAG: ABC transporter permease [Chloracidobacterium sp.]|nr:ABC transporter permease [Chloracidobacterium sp.]